jgi:hypothetical protein
MTIYVKTQKYERGGWLKFKLIFSFMETTQEPLHLFLDKWNSAQ